ncbi:MAG: hypothetical protein II694_06280, partial [Lachnospiraceae bacterium]|nr:hypothetical protein [Lachnospiraceae bacterium]
EREPWDTLLEPMDVKTVYIARDRSRFVLAQRCEAPSALTDEMLPIASRYNQHKNKTVIPYKYGLTVLFCTDSAKAVGSISSACRSLSTGAVGSSLAIYTGFTF